MSGFIILFKQFNKHYSKAILLSVLLHAILLVAILQSKFTPPKITVKPEPIISYLYSAPVASNIQPEQTAAASIKPKVEVKAEVRSANTKLEQVTGAQLQPKIIEPSQSVIAELEQRPISKHEAEAEQPKRPGLSLAQRALNRATGATAVDIEQAAAVGYQQFLQSQQQPKITVAKRYQALSSSPAHQVLAQLNDGRQLIRTKEGCRIADPSDDSFAALMAANTLVPCGDEISTRTLLQQALDKHIK